MILSTSKSFTLVCFLSIAYPVFGAVPCAPVRVRGCPGVEPSQKATLAAVYISDCFEEPCFFTRDRNVTMEMDIDFHGTVTNMQAELHALIGGEIPWDGVNREACEDIVSDGDCPFKDGDYITYGVDLYIEPLYPRVRTDVRYRILDENNEILICWIVRAQVR